MFQKQLNKPRNKFVCRYLTIMILLYYYYSNQLFCNNAAKTYNILIVTSGTDYLLFIFLSTIFKVMHRTDILLILS